MKTPPHNTEIERAVLGSLFLDGEKIHTALERIGHGDFYREPHRIIFSAMAALAEMDPPRPIDFQTVAETLKRWGKLEAAGGVAYLTDLIDAVGASANIGHYLTILGELGTLRQLLTTAQEIADRCYQGLPDNLDEFLNEAEALVFTVAERRIRRDYAPATQLITRAMQTVEILYERKEAITGVPSGFKDLDSLTAGFQPSDLIIIAGRPSMGKTSLALNVATYAATEANVPAAIFSLEMSAEQLALRMLCSVARVNLNSVRTGFLSPDDWGRLTTAMGAFPDHLVVDDTAQSSVLEIRSKSRRIQRERGLGLVIVDYLQLMRGHRKSGESREREISEISRSLKALAKELNVPVIALSQLNRKVEERPDKRPKLSDLRESGAIEQDADVIIFIYRDEVYNDSLDNPKRGTAEIIIGKQRNGPIGKISVAFEARSSTFRPLAHRDDAPQMEAL